jgi:hypothetical protein
MLRSMCNEIPKKAVKPIIILSLVASVSILTVFIKPITAYSSKISALKNTGLNNHSISGPAELRVSKANQLVLEGGREVVEVTGININGLPVNLGAPFNAERVSLDELGIGIKNLSEKTITHIKFGLYLRGNSRAIQEDPFYPLEYGVDTGLPGNKASENLHPNETATVSVPQARAQYLKQFVAQRGSDVAKIEILIEGVIFDDDTAWRHGLMARRTKDNPLVWQYTSGKYAKNWSDSSPKLGKALNIAGLQNMGQHSLMPKPWKGDQLMWSAKAEPRMGPKSISTAPSGQFPCGYPQTFYYAFCTQTCYVILDAYNINIPVYQLGAKTFSCFFPTTGAFCGTTAPSAYIVSNCGG